MSWTCRLSGEAAKQLQKLPRDRQQQLRQALQEMQESLWQGDVRPVR